MTRCGSYFALTAVMICGAAACGDDAAGPDPAGAGGSGGGGGTTAQAGGGAGGAGAGGDSGGGIDLYGSFNVTLVPPFEETMTAAMTSVIGRVRDGVTPEPMAWRLEAEQATCKLYEPMPVLCIPSCGGGAVCTAENTCAPYPKPTTVGTVTITGVGTEPLVMDPVADNYQPKAGVILTYPPCAEGASVRVEAAGGMHAPFEMVAPCIAPLEFSGPVMYQPGQPLRLVWTAAIAPTASKIDVKIDLSHHGGTKGKIECQVPDSGALEIPAALIDALVELGVAGFPSVTLTRSARAAGSGSAANVELIISSPQDRPIVIPGLTSCSEDGDCPMGEVCMADRACG